MQAAARELWSRPAAERAALALAVAAVVLVGVADLLLPNLAFNDDWGFAWSVAHFPRIYPADSALAFPEDAWAWLVTGASEDHRWLRLSTLVFVAASVAGVHRLARAAGADRTVSAVAALALAAFPVFSVDATSFMTDVPYVALELWATLALIRWVEGRWPAAIFVLLVVLATLQRQVGVLLPLAAGAALLATGSWRRWPWVAVAAGVALAALLAVSVSGLAPPTQPNRLADALHPSALYAVTTLMFAPAVVGLALAPLLPALVAARGGRHLGPAAVGLVVWEVFVALAAGGNLLPGNVLVPQGFNSTPLGGVKPQLFPTPLFAGLEVLAGASAVAFVLRLRRALAGAPFAALALAAVAVAQLLPVLFVEYRAIDRYFLPLAAALLPLAARAGTGAPRAATRAGIAVAVGFLALYVAGEQDYGSWQAARDAAARLAYAEASPLTVDAGYEANAVYGTVPAYDRDGTMLDGLAQRGRHDFSMAGPEHPVLRLAFAAPGDPRPGVGYRSLAPGRIVIVRVPES